MLHFNTATDKVRMMRNGASQSHATSTSVPAACRSNGNGDASSYCSPQKQQHHQHALHQLTSAGAPVNIRVNSPLSCAQAQLTVPSRYNNGIQIKDSEIV